MVLLIICLELCGVALEVAHNATAIFLCTEDCEVEIYLTAINSQLGIAAKCYGCCA